MPQQPRLPRNLLHRPTLKVAERLLGAILQTGTGSTRTSGMIVEVKAYHGLTDQASHSYHGPTKRNHVMFGAPGFCYVYFIYGNHFCVNVVTEEAGIGAAVLIRALEPIAGTAMMQTRRGARISAHNLTNGPGKLCEALGIDTKMLGEDLCSSKLIGLYEHKRFSAKDIVTTKRIGISKSAKLPWRFYLRGNPWVSR